MAQVIQHTEKPDDVIPTRRPRERIHGAFAKLDALGEAVLLRGPARLTQIAAVDIHRGDRRAAPGQLEAIEAGIAAHVEHAAAVQVTRQVRLDLPPLHQRKIAERMRRRGLPAVRQMQVVEPRAELLDLAVRPRARCLRFHDALAGTLPVPKSAR